MSQVQILPPRPNLMSYEWKTDRVKEPDLERYLEQIEKNKYEVQFVVPVQLLTTQFMVISKRPRHKRRH